MYTFDIIIDQKNTYDEKHDQIHEYFSRDDLLPMWVAEMDFPTAPEVLDAMMQRVQHGIFGYTYRSESYQQAIVDWYKTQHQCTIEKDMIAYDTGVLKSIFEMLRIFTKEDDRVLVPIPAYPQFEKVITLAKRTMVSFSLTNEHHRYVFDFDALDQALSSCKVCILCSPHNPGGRIWSFEELTKIASLCKKHQVLLICDEIHCDLTMNHHTFISMLNIDDQCIIMNSISKPFNLAGLQHSYSICKDKDMNQKIHDHYHKYKIKSMNTLSMLAQESAYTKGRVWLHEVREYIYANDQYIRQFIDEHQMNIPIFTLEASYLQWLDFSAYVKNAEELEDFLVNTCHIATSFGRHFDEYCGCFTRLNIGTQRVNCEEAMNRIYHGLQQKGWLK